MESATGFFGYDFSSTQKIENNDSFNETSDLSSSGALLKASSHNITVILYKYVAPILIVTCLVSFIVNLKILVASRWLRKPISPNLKINLSLAGADAYASFCLGIGLFVNSWLPIIRMQIPTNICPMLILEGLRLGGIITVVFHILFLSINHYASIVKPLHYSGMITSKYTTFTLVAIWTVPPSSFLVYFALQPEDGLNKINCGYNFLRRWNFRIVFFGLFLAPFTLMVYIYLHIFAIVRQHQRMRDRFLRTDPSLRRQDSTRFINSSSELQKNIKAIFTTLMMLGSYVVGWLPGLVYFIIVCDDCYYSFQYFNPITTFSIGFVTNLFIILKTLFNPMIYASRISDIKAATMKMHNYIRNMWKNMRNPQSNRDRMAFGMHDYSGHSEYFESTTTSRML